MGNPNERIKVTKDIIGAIDEVRADGAINIYNHKQVARKCLYLGWYEAAIWIDENPIMYSRLIFEGGIIADRPTFDPGVSYLWDRINGR